jgi:hypothetical protein
MLMVNETATENNVNASFLVPSLSQGNYTLTLLDTTANINATSWFFIETAYHLQITKPTPPEQLQENATVEISINVTGGEPNTIYAANITVEAPAPSNGHIGCWYLSTPLILELGTQRSHTHKTSVGLIQIIMGHTLFLSMEPWQQTLFLWA